MVEASQFGGEGGRVWGKAGALDGDSETWTGAHRDESAQIKNSVQRGGPRSGLPVRVRRRGGRAAGGPVARRPAPPMAAALEDSLEAQAFGAIESWAASPAHPCPDLGHARQGSEIGLARAGVGRVGEPPMGNAELQPARSGLARRMRVPPNVKR